LSRSAPHPPTPAPDIVDWAALTPAGRETATLIAMRLTAGLTLDEIAVELERDRSKIKRNPACSSPGRASGC